MSTPSAHLSRESTRLPPFDAWPIEEHDPRFGYRWYREPAMLIDCLTVVHGTRESVRAMYATLDSTLTVHAKSIVEAGGLLIIGDWRNLRSYDPEARQLFLSELRKPRHIRGSIVMASKAGVFVRMAAQTARMVTAVVGGPSITVTEDVDAVLREHGLAAAPRNSVPLPRV